MGSMNECQEDLMAESLHSRDIEEAEVDAVTLDCPKDSDIPPGYLHDTSKSIKPLDTKTLKLMKNQLLAGTWDVQKRQSLQYPHLQYK